MREIKTLTIQFIEWALARGQNKRVSMKQVRGATREGRLGGQLCEGMPRNRPIRQDPAVRDEIRDSEKGRGWVECGRSKNANSSFHGDNADMPREAKSSSWSPYLLNLRISPS